MRAHPTTVAAVDLGAESGRVAAVTFNGTRLRLDVTHRFTHTPHPVDGTQPPVVEHFSPEAQSAAPVHFAVQVPLCKQTCVLPQLPMPWQLCAQVPLLVQAWPLRQSPSAPQPSFGTQPFEAEHFPVAPQLASVAHFVAHSFVSRHVSVGEQSVPDWHCAPTAPGQLQALKTSAAPATTRESHREVCVMSLLLDQAPRRRAGAIPEGTLSWGTWPRLFPDAATCREWRHKTAPSL